MKMKNYIYWIVGLRDSGVSEYSELIIMKMRENFPSEITGTEAEKIFLYWNKGLLDSGIKLFGKTTTKMLNDFITQTIDNIEELSEKELDNEIDNIEEELEDNIEEEKLSEKELDNEIENILNNME